MRLRSARSRLSWPKLRTTVERLGPGVYKRQRVSLIGRKPIGEGMFRLDGRIALVTGGSRGIGRACSEALASQGATVVVNYVKGETAAREVADAITSKGGKAEISGFDVADTKTT